MQLLGKHRVTVVLATHSIDEALLLSDQIVLMSSDPNARISHLLDLSRIRSRQWNRIETHRDFLAVRQRLEGHLFRKTRVIEET